MTHAHDDPAGRHGWCASRVTVGEEPKYSREHWFDDEVCIRSWTAPTKRTRSHHLRNWRMPRHLVARRLTELVGDDEQQLRVAEPSRVLA